MGSDIRAFIEYRSDGVWIGYAAVSPERSRALFAAIEETIPSRGFPRDASGDTRLAYELVLNSDALRPSWMTLNELETAFERAGLTVNEFAIEWPLVVQTLNTIETKFARSARLVYWFES